MQRAPFPPALAAVAPRFRCPHCRATCRCRRRAGGCRRGTPPRWWPRGRRPSGSVAFELSLRPDDVRAIVAMGPSAHHVGDPAELERRIERLGEPVSVTASVVVATFTRP